MVAVWRFLVALPGLDLQPEKFGYGQLIVRGVVIFGVALALMRLGHKRSLARKSAFDTVLVVIVGAILARAINGSAAFFFTIVGAFVLVLLHRALGWLAYHSGKFERLIKGRPSVLLRDGTLRPEAMRRHGVTQHDLSEDLHLRGHEQLGELALARIERSGDISFIPRQAGR